MNEIFLMKLGEIVLKGGNKRQFESRLRQNVRRRMKHYGNFDVYIMQSTVYVEPQDEMADVECAWEACHNSRCGSALRGRCLNGLPRAVHTGPRELPYPGPH